MMSPLIARIRDRARWELREWRRPSAPSFTLEELDRALLDAVGDCRGGSALDLGCGDGRYVARLQRLGLDAVGIDLDRNAVARTSNQRGRLAVADGERLPFDDQSFDLVLAHRILYLISRPRRMLSEIERVLRPGGRFVFSVSNVLTPNLILQDMFVRAVQNKRWARGNHWTLGQWKRSLEDCGLQPEAVFSCNLVWPWVYRIGDRWLLSNEIMRRYARLIRRLSGVSVTSGRQHALASDYVVVAQQRRRIVAIGLNGRDRGPDSTLPLDVKIGKATSCVRICPTPSTGVARPEKNIERGSLVW